MAITRLMHMKEAPGIPYTHLKNAIDYILDIRHEGAKTNYGEYVGGNAGTDNRQILQTFLTTKEDFGKPDGRQGYHFVISFPPGETDAASACEVAKEFCEGYLGDAYDYVYAAHTDKKHMHVHVVFNSVSRITGLKYHYKKGDWKKDIQPITDRVCKEHGLTELTFEEERVGVSYASWAQKKEGKINWSHIIRADVDFAIHRSDSFDMFFEELRKIGYTLRFGHSRKRNEDYITYTFRGEDGKEHRRRSYNLPPGYSLKEIMQRIQTKSGERSFEDVAERMHGQARNYLAKPVSFRSTQTYKRLYQAASYYRLPNPYAVPAYRVRKDMIRIGRLLEECRYLQQHRITGRESLAKEGAYLEHKIKNLTIERKKLYGILDAADGEEKKGMERYHSLQIEMNKALKEGSDAFEQIEDEMKVLERSVPHDLLETKGRIDDCNRQLAAAKKDLRIWKRIYQTEKGQSQEMPELAVSKKI